MAGSPNLLRLIELIAAQMFILTNDLQKKSIIRENKISLTYFFFA